MSKDLVKERGEKYLNDVLNMRDNFGRLISSFTADILEKDPNPTDETKQEMTHYIDLANALRYTYVFYRNNAETFERQTLQLNSVISTSLMIEYRINDLTCELFDKSEKEKEKSINNLINDLKELKESEFTKELKDRDRLSDMIDEQIRKFTNVVKEINDDKKKIKETLNELMNDPYHIPTMSKDENLKPLINDIILTCITNEFCEEYRELAYKKNNVVIENKTPKKDRLQCLNLQAYETTQNKIKDLIRLSLLNEGENVIDKEAFDLFNVFINLKENITKAEYKERFEEHLKALYKETGNDYNNLFIDFEAYSKNLLQELRWCDFEE